MGGCLALNGRAPTSVREGLVPEMERLRIMQTLANGDHGVGEKVNVEAARERLLTQLSYPLRSRPYVDAFDAAVRADRDESEGPFFECANCEDEYDVSDRVLWHPPLSGDPAEMMELCVGCEGYARGQRDAEVALTRDEAALLVSVMSARIIEAQDAGISDDEPSSRFRIDLFNKLMDIRDGASQ